jgi:outer membrane protein
MNPRYTIVAALLLTALIPTGATAAEPGADADLLGVYRDAKANDPVYASAQAALEAGREKLPQGRALVLPSLTFTAGAQHSEHDETFDAPVTLPSGERDFRAGRYQLSLSQPLFHRPRFIQYSQSGYLVEQAEAAFGIAQQDLILRTARSYFDVLAAQDALGYARSQKAAIAEQLEQAKQHFEVGAATITDTHEAQARFDLASAQEIAAQNELEIRNRMLAQITGRGYDTLQPLREDLALALPEPGNMEAWVALGEKQGLALRAQQAQLDFQTLELKRNRAASFPTLELVASYIDNDQTGSAFIDVGSHAKTGTVGVQLSVPIYAGGGLRSREREAAALLTKARFDFDSVRRQQSLAVQQNYLNVMNGISQVKALEQALVSSESALESNKLAYDVGVRINIDVLNAQQQVTSTRRELARARYNAILSLLGLKAAAGALEEKDLEQINGALTP